MPFDTRRTHRKVPVDRVGLYVPGGLAPLVSSVVMNVVPAQAAGVESLVVSSPPQAQFGGLPHPTILAACGALLLPAGHRLRPVDPEGRHSRTRHEGR